MSKLTREASLSNHLVIPVMGYHISSMQLQLIISMRSSSSHTCNGSSDYVFLLWARS